LPKAHVLTGFICCCADGADEVCLKKNWKNLLFEDVDTESCIALSIPNFLLTID